MAARLNPYVSFDGNAREAMEFYQSVFGGSWPEHLRRVRRASAPRVDKLMHGQLETAEWFHADGLRYAARMPYNPGDNITISLSGDDDRASRLLGQAVRGRERDRAAGEADVG